MLCRIAIVAILSSLLALPVTTHGQCLEYSDYLHHLGYAGTYGSAQDLDLHGLLAYVADGNDGFTVLDVSDLTNIRIIGHRLTSGSCSDVVVRDGRLLSRTASRVASRSST